MLRIVLWSVVACAFGIFGIPRASAEDYVVSVEELIYSDATYDDVKQLYATGTTAEKPEAAEGPQGEVAQSVEIRVTPNVPFHCRTKFGEKTVTISGTLVRGNVPGRFQLNVDRKSSEGRGQKVILAGGRSMDMSPLNVASMRQQIEVGKPAHFGPFAQVSTAGKKTSSSTKGTFVVNTFRLEPVEDGR